MRLCRQAPLGGWLGNGVEMVILKRPILSISWRNAKCLMPADKMFLDLNEINIECSKDWGQLPPAQQNVTITRRSSANSSYKQKQGNSPSMLFKKYLGSLQNFDGQKCQKCVLNHLGPSNRAHYFGPICLG